MKRVQKRQLCAHMKKDEDLEPLRRRADFQTVLAELGEKAQATAK